MIDAHVHVWTLDAGRYPWQQTLAHVPIPTRPATADDLLAEMERAGVDGAVLVQPSVYGWRNDYLCDCLERHPGRFAGVCLVDPRSPTAGSDLRYWCAERGCHGLRVNLIGEQDASWVLDAVPDDLWAVAAELGVSVSLQLLPRHAELARTLARRHPDVTFLADYLGFDAFHDGSGLAAVDVLAREPNVWLKLVAVTQDSREGYPFRDLWPLYERATARFGAERLVFGTDFPHVRERSTYAEAIAWLAELPFLDDDARAAVGDANARALWRLDPTPIRRT